MKHTIMLFLFLMSGLMIFAGCAKPPAIVNGKTIDKKTFELRLNDRLQSHKQRDLTIDMAKIKQAVIQELIAELLILDAAAEEGIQVSDEEIDNQIAVMRKSTGEAEFHKKLNEKGITSDRFRSMTKDKIIISKFVITLIKDDEVPADAIREYYTNSPKPFIRPIRVFMKLIEFPTEEAANTALESMKNEKISFDKMAEKLKKEKKAFSTDYGWVNPAVFSPSIAAATQNIDAGAYGGPYKGKNSYFLIRIKEREKESVATFEEVKAHIKNILLQQKRQTTIAHWVADKKKMARIEINI